MNFCENFNIFLERILVDREFDFGSILRSFQVKFDKFHTYDIF